MKNIFLMMGLTCLVLGGPGAGFAEGEAAQTDWKQTLTSDKQAIAQQRDEMKASAQAGKTEEKTLQDQIKAARASGDKEKAKSLEDQLKAMHQENVAQRKQDKQDIKTARQELNQDRKAAGYPPKMDKDNNPPGAKGGPGTNWENPKGPKGGPGAGPNRGQGMDRDNNPPGAKGGPGTNWENPKGPKGGPGASPNRNQGKGGGNKGR
ncbi:MAG: hypothetical protein WC352_00350 [Candidatus Omnitrophota bacterium]|jgi:hypothetical protein